MTRSKDNLFKRIVAISLAALLLFSDGLLLGSAMLVRADDLFVIASENLNAAQNDEPEDITALSSQFPYGGVGQGGRLVPFEDYIPTSTNWGAPDVPPTFDLAAFNNIAQGQESGINIEWTGTPHGYPFGAQRYELGFLYYQRMQNEDDTWTNWETRSTVTERPINVLVIAPDTTLRLGTSTSDVRRRIQRWMHPQEGANPSSTLHPNGQIRIMSVTSGMFSRGIMPGGTWPETNAGALPNGDRIATTDLITNDPNTILRHPPGHPQAGQYRFDVIVIGTQDLNGGTGSVVDDFSIDNDFGARTQQALNEFLDSGRGILFGHDVFFDSSYAVVGTRDRGILPGVVGTPAIRTTTARRGWNWHLARMANRAGILPTNRAGRFAHRGIWMTVVNDGHLMRHPNRVELGATLRIPDTHGNSAATRGTIWARITYANGNLRTTSMPDLGAVNNPAADTLRRAIIDGVVLPESTLGNLIFDFPPGDPNFTAGRYETNFYLSTYRNTAHIQAGHAGNTSQVAERRMIANSIFFLTQLTFDNYFNDMSAFDFRAPVVSDPWVAGTGTTNAAGLTETTVRIHAEDFGTVYQGRISAAPQIPVEQISGFPAEHELDSEGRARSNVYEETVISGTRAYFVVQGSATARPTVRRDDYGQVDLTPVSGTRVILHNDDGTNFSTSINWNNLVGQYLHIIAVDYAHNESELLSIPLANLRVGIDLEIVTQVSPGQYVPAAGANWQIGGTTLTGVMGASGRAFIPMTQFGVFPIIASATVNNNQYSNISIAAISETNRMATVRIVLEPGAMIWG
jgi:hypothetical protein